MPYPRPIVPMRRMSFLLGLYSSLHLHPLIQQPIRVISIMANITMLINLLQVAFVSQVAMATPTKRSTIISPRISSSSSSALTNLGRIAMTIVRQKKILARVCLENMSEIEWWFCVDCSTLYFIRVI